LVLTFTLNQLSHRQAILGQALLNPAYREFYRRRFFLNAAQKFRHEGLVQSRLGTGHFPHDNDQVGRIVFRHLQNFVRPGSGRVPILSLHVHLSRHAPQIFDQREP